MRTARRLVAEMELWRLVWQQVETFADRIESARDQDAAGAARFVALMIAAGVVERERATRVDSKPLSDPVADEPPSPNLSDGWSKPYRIWRIPGTDELELAVGNLYLEPGTNEPGSDTDPIRLLPSREYFSYFVEPEDPRFEASDNGVVTLTAPSYPARGGATILGPAPAVVDAAIGPGLQRPGIEPITEIGAPDEEIVDVVSLFSPKSREFHATDIDQSGNWIQSWSGLTENRRRDRGNADEADVKYFSAGSSALPWTPAMADTAQDLVIAVRINQPLADGLIAITVAGEIAAAAENAANFTARDSTLLREAAEALEEAGVEDDNLPPILNRAADTFGQRPALFAAVGGTARLLQGLLAEPLGSPTLGNSLQNTRNAAASQLEAAVAALTDALLAANEDLFDDPVEAGPLATEANMTVAARVAYPDGTLRILRALEEAFIRFWPSRMRWFKDRHRYLLDTLIQRFRAPFVHGLRALTAGGDTGLPVEGLQLLTAAATRTVQLNLDLPASLATALKDVEAGHVGLFLDGRQSAAVILGMAPREGRLTLNIAELRVSTAEPPEGAPATDGAGIIAGGRTLATFFPGTGLPTAALRTGDHPVDPSSDGIVETAMVLYGQLALLFGWQTVESELGVAAPNYNARRIPDPSDSPAESLSLYGTLAARATTIAIRGAGNDFWDRSDPAAPEPRFARSGEYLLIRGRSETDAGTPGPMRQAVAQVEMAYRTTVKMFHRMDASSIALLSTTPLPSADIDTCLADCEPEEDLIILLFSRTWQTRELVSDVTLRRDFDGFDAPSLATGRLLPDSVVRTITSANPPGPSDVDRSAEFEAASGILADWVRFARR